MSVVQIDPGAAIHGIALQNIAATRIAIEALDQIAGLQHTCPLASEIAVRGLRELKAELVDDPGEAMARIGVSPFAVTR